MAGLAPTILKQLGKQVVKKLLPAGAAGAAAGVANEVRKKQEASDDAKSTPVAGVQSKAKTETCTKDQKKCDECPPENGVPWQRNFKERRIWVDYQARICGMPNGPNFIIEWLFKTVYFDGFDPSQCQLKEAKAAYDQFFDQWGGFNYVFQRDIFTEMLDEAVKQNMVSKPMPPVRLTWYFMEPVSFRYMERVLHAATPQIEVLFRP